MTLRSTIPRSVLWLLVAVLLSLSCTPSEDVDPDPATGDPEDGREAAGEVTPEEEPTAFELAFAEIAGQVSVLRELPQLDEVDVELVSPERLAEVVSDRDPDTEALTRTEAAQRVLVALRHLPEDADLVTIRDELLATAVVGLYDPYDAVAYVSSEAESLGPAATATLAHELVHALQDQHFDLGRLDALPEDDGDAFLAFLSVIEGDAVLLEEAWSAAHQSDEERAEAERERLAGARGQVEQLREAPPYIVESFVFPYVVGERFVAALINEGGHEAVDAALAEPPTTTLEVLDPDQYLGGGLTPTEVQAGVAPGDGWEPSFRSTFGAFDLLALFGAAAGPEAAQGSTAWPAWRGGALESWDRDGEIVVAVGWAFADDARAGTVCEALPAWYADVADGDRDADVWRSDRDVLAVDCDGTEVRFALGPDADAATAALEVD